MRLLDLGVFVEKKSEMPNIFFLGLLPLSFCLFSSLSQPFSFMIQKSLVNIPARQLYWASQRPPLCTELSGSQHSFCNAQLFTHWSSPQNHLFWLLYYLFSKKNVTINNNKISHQEAQRALHLVISVSMHFQTEPYALILCLCREISATATCVLLKSNNLLLWLTLNMNRLQNVGGWWARVKIGFTCFTVGQHDPRHGKTISSG